LDALFNPSSLALIGASNDEHKAGGMFLKSLIDDGFKGKLYPVNPREAEIMSLRSYLSVADIPGEVDLAIFTIPNRFIPPTMEECARKGVKNVVIHSAGFSEIGGEGSKLEAEMLRIAGEGGIRIVGPNCMGIYSPRAGINTIVPGLPIHTREGPAAFVGQSGWICENYILMTAERGLGCNKVISSGNQSDLKTIDYLRHFGDDPEIKVIGLYVEQIKGGTEFFNLARKIIRKKPILGWKSGKSRAGARAVRSHTGSLAGSDAAYEAAFRQAGIIRVDNLDQLTDYSVAFATPYLPAGNRVALIMEAGGGAVSASDACESAGLIVPQLPSKMQKALDEYFSPFLPPAAGRSNPIDLVWPPQDKYPDILSHCINTISSMVDMFIVTTYYPLNEEKLMHRVIELQKEVKKPIFMVAGHHIVNWEGMRAYTARGIPTFTTPVRAGRAAAVLCRYSAHRRKVA
jgi:acetyltransferase